VAKRHVARREARRDRRNLTGKELVNVIAIVDLAKRKARGGTGANRYTASTEKPSGFSVPENRRAETRYEVAELVGTSPPTVDRARVIYDDPEAMAEVERGVITPPRRPVSTPRVTSVCCRMARCGDRRGPDGPQWASRRFAGAKRTAGLQTASRGIPANFADLGVLLRAAVCGIMMNVLLD